MDYQSDIVVVGAGPAGLCFCNALAGSSLTITLVEKQPETVLANPPYDAREIALTHPSREIMQKIGVWAHVPTDEIYRLRDAKVMDGMSPYLLHFPEPKRARGGATDRLGYFIPNHIIRRAAYEAMKTLPNVTLLTERSVEDVATHQDSTQVTLDNGDTITAKLLVCADSRFSTTRQKVGIPTDMHQFGRTVICFRVSHTKSNEHTAYECFHYGRTLAILPLSEHLSNMVVTIDTDKAERLLNLSDEELAQDIYAETNGRLGEITVAGTRHTYPLVGTHARRFYDTRAALIGDAAVGMHPVTAHGFNLGLESVAILSDCILKAAARSRDIGSQDVLERYNRRHMMKTRVIYHGTNFVVKLFTNETTPARLVRKALLRASNHFPPVKMLISKQLTG